MKNPIDNFPWQVNWRIIVILGLGESGKTIRMTRVLNQMSEKLASHEFFIVNPNARPCLNSSLRSIPSIVYTREKIVLAIDEAQQFQGAAIPPELKNFVYRANYNDLYLIVNTRRPQNVHPEILENFDVLYVYRVEAENGLKKLRDYCSREQIEKIRNLSKFHCELVVR